MTITGNFEDCFLEELPPCLMELHCADVHKLQEEGSTTFDTDLFVIMGQLCRVCARPHEDMVPIFSGRGQQLGVDKMIHGHLPIKVSKYDKLPVQLCSLCMERLLVCEMLVAECMEADKKLQAMLTRSQVANDKVLSDVADDSPELLLDSEINQDVKMPELTDQMSGEAEMLGLDSHVQTVDSLICGAPCELMLDANDSLTELNHASYHFYSDCDEDHCSSLETSTWNDILDVAEIPQGGLEEPAEENLHELDLELGTGAENKKLCQSANSVEMMDDVDIPGLHINVDNNCKINSAMGNLFQDSCHKKFSGNESDADYADDLTSETKPSVEAIAEVVTVASSGEMLPSNFEDDKIACITIPEVNVSNTLKILPDNETMSIISKDSSLSQLELLGMPDEQNGGGNYSFIANLDSLPSSNLLSSMDEGTKMLDLPFQQQYASVSVMEDVSRASEQVGSPTSVTSDALLEPLDSNVPDKMPMNPDNGNQNQHSDVQNSANITSNKSQTLDSETSGTTLSMPALNVNTAQVPYIRVLPDKSSEVKTRDKCLYDAIKVKRASRVNMIVLKAEHLQKELPQATIMANILKAVQKMNVKQQQEKMTNKAVCAGTIVNEARVSTDVTAVKNCPETTNSVTDSNDKPAVRMENIAKLQLVNLEFMPKLTPDENHPPKRFPYLYMKVSEKFDNIEEKPKSAIVGAIHNLVSHDAARKQKDGVKEKERGYQCTMCGMRFEQWRAWRTHEREHRMCSIPQCNTCHKVFKNENSLRFHMRRHLLGTPTKRYMCQTCEKTFYSHAAAKDHTRIHTGERPFVCATCGKAFTRKFALKMHHRSHLRTRDPKPMQPKFVCAVCGEEMATESAWKAHTKLHIEETSHECGTCHKNFVSTGRFKSHVKKCGKLVASIELTSVQKIVCFPDVSSFV